MVNALKSKLVLLILIGFSSSSYGQSFVLTSDDFLPLYMGPIKWADLDNDNDLDLIYAGIGTGSNQYAVKIYENNNGSFVSRFTSLPNIRNGSFALGDYDKDGDTDILLSGTSTTGDISELYKNNGAFSFSLKQSFPGLINTTVSWFDIDNDEDLDFLLSGLDNRWDSPTPYTKQMMVYENVNGNFNLITGTNLPPCTQCSMDWADSNGDGKTDLLITGFREDYNGYTELYLNNGNKTFTKDQNSIFVDVFNGDVKWGDFDNDGDMDALLSGMKADVNIITSVYRNTNGVLTEEENIRIYSTGENWMGGTGWVDYNNDGLLDILVSGRGISGLVGEYILKLYKNKGDGTFAEVSDINFAGMSDSSVDFGDFDNDGDVDFCFSGTSSIGIKTGIYENKLIDNSYKKNSKPTPPSIGSLSESFFRKQVKFLWSSGADMETPAAGLSYNFYLKQGTSKVVVPTSNFTSGYVLAANPPNGHARISVLNNLREGASTWAVQAVDGGKSGSVFSSEKTFYQINGPEAIKTEIIDVTKIRLSWLDNSSVEASYQITRSTNPIAGFSPLATLPPNTSSYIDNFAFATDTYYYYRIYAVNATKASAYDSLSALIPTAPENFLAQTINISKITLSWEDLSQYESGYELQRKLHTGYNFQTIALLASNTESYIDTGLSEGIRYDYRVRALVNIGSSVFSNTSSAQTNFRPLGINFQKETLEDKTLNFTAEDFIDAFSDPDTNDQLVAINIVTLPSKGILKLNTTSVATGQVIQLADLENLKFVPLLNANGFSEFSFYNNDGKDISSLSNTVKLVINSVNDAPVLLSIPDQQVAIQSTIPRIGFIVTDVDSPITSVIVSATSDNELVIKDDNITIEGTAHNKSILLLPEKNVGDALITVTANDGETSTSIQFKLEIFSVTGVSETVNKEVKIFPNPFSSSINVTLTEPVGDRYKAILFNQLGKEILRQAITQQESILTLKEIPSGIYMLTIFGSNGDMVFSTKIVKDK